MKVCNKCNFSNEDSNVVCTKCGALLEAPKSKYSFYNKPIIRTEEELEEKANNNLQSSLISKESATKAVEDVMDKVKGIGEKLYKKLDSGSQNEFVYNEEEAKKVEMEQSKNKKEFVFDEKAAKKAAKLEAKMDATRPFVAFDEKALKKAEKIEKQQEKEKLKFFFIDEDK